MKIFYSKQNFFFLISYFTWILYLYLLYTGSNFIKGGNFTNGYKLGNDSSRYINAAESLLKFTFPDGKALSYLSYEFFLAFILYFRNNLFDVVIFQIILTGISAYCLYQITKLIFNKNIAILSFIVFLFYPDLQIRNFYILTESLIISLPIISFFLIFRYNRVLNIIGYILLLISSFVRPHAVVLIPILLTLIFFEIHRINKKIAKKVLFISFFIFLFFFIILINFLLKNENILNILISGQIIGEYDGLKIKSKPDELIKNSGNLIDIFLLIIQNPLFFIKAFFIKLFWFFARIRPYYSDLHNLFIIFLTIPLYVTFIFGLFYKTNYKYIKNILFFYITLVTFSVCITFIDWSGRFLLPIIPIIIIFSSAGLFKIFNLLKIFIKNK